MTVQDFRLPDLGEGLTEGTIVEWLVAVGDRVALDQVVAQVETAKAVVEVPSPYEGEVVTLHAEEGEEVVVGEPLLSVRTGEGAGAGDEAAAAAGGEAAGAGAEPADGNSRGEGGDGGEGGGGDDGESGSVLVGYGTRARRASRRRAGANGAAAGTAAHTTATRAPSPAPGREGIRPGDSGQSAAGSTGPADGSGRPLAKPPVRKLAKDLGVDLWRVAPSGPGGVITRDDVQAAAAAGDEGRAPAAGVGDEPERIPVTGVRKRIAERMTVSRREIPEATCWVDCDATDLMRARAEINARQERVRVSPLALILRACVAGLRRHPELNSAFDAEAGEIVRHRAVHLGVAAQTERGLVVPVIRDAHRLTTLELAAELVRLSEGARAGKLTPAELTGSTFTVSNYGSFGVDGGNPVINHPEAAILGVGRITDKPWVVDGELAVRKVCELSVAFDHRVCDGGEAAGFLRFVADCVESTATLLAEL